MENVKYIKREVTKKSSAIEVETSPIKKRITSSNAASPLTNSSICSDTSTSTPDQKLYYRNGLYSRLYKVIVIGEIGTGKSALVRRYVHSYFNGDPGFNRSTIGVDFSLKILPYNEDLEIRLQLWDIAGQERFSSMTRAYYQGTMGALLVFDHTNAKSFEAIQRWKQDLDVKCMLPSNRRVPAVLVCNKADLPRDTRLPDDLEISRYVQEEGFAPKWFKTSARTGENVDEALSLIVRYIMTLDTWSMPLSDTEDDCPGNYKQHCQLPAKTGSRINLTNIDDSSNHSASYPFESGKRNFCAC